MKKKILFAAFILVMSGFWMMDPEGEKNRPNKREDSGTITDISSNSYANYLNKYPQAFPSNPIKVDLSKFTFYRDKDQEGLPDSEIELPYEDAFEGKNGLYIPEDGAVEFKFLAFSEGYYNLKLDYYSVIGRSANISKGIMINGEFPFKESKDLSFTRTWYDEYSVSSLRKENKNDLKPKSIERHVWNNDYVLKDINGLYNDNYKFHFKRGENILRFTSNREPIVIANLSLFNEVALKNYAEYFQEKAELKKIQDQISIEAEDSYQKSSPILGGITDNTSSKVSPYSSNYLRLNTIGGINFRVPGDWISWKFDAPEEGLYKITFKIIQNFNRGMFTTRSLSVNGEIPFEEAKFIEFPYSSDFQNITCGKNGEDFYFHLKKGENTIKLSSTTGRYSSLIQTVQDVIADLNLMYRQIVVKTGVSPDINTEYFLEKYVPNIIERIKENMSVIEKTKSDFIQIGKNRSDKLGPLERTLITLKKFDKDLYNVPRNLNEFKENIASLGTWVTDIKEQSLAIDLIYIHNTEKLPKASSNFFQKIWRQITLFFGSFFNDYEMESNASGNNGTIKVWVSTGRDQAQIIRQMIDESFTPRTGINVELKLVNGGVLLPATLAKKGPDVAMQVGEDTPVNWGIRNAVYDISRFPDFEEVKSRFYESSINPYCFGGKCYGLPETHNFLTLFYRKDILEELGVEVPATWDDMLNILPILQRKNLEIYIPSGGGSAVLYSMIEQYGGQVYLEDGAKSGLLEKESQEAFIDFTELFSLYKFSMNASFPNRFRTGEMPIGISYYTEYNLLSVFAPEINGLWDFAPMLGIKDEETGEIINTSISNTASVIMFQNTKMPQESWEYMKWWTEKDTQVSYARQLEGLLGPSARHPVSNIEAFSELPWPKREYNILINQMKHSKNMPVVPGSYILGRYVDNAFRNVINDMGNPRNALYDNVRKINEELARKRKEFGLS